MTTTAFQERKLKKKNCRQLAQFWWASLAISQHFISGHCQPSIMDLRYLRYLSTSRAAN